MKKVRLNSQWIQSIFDCYSALGERPKGVPKNLLHYHCQGWRIPVMSPVVPLEPQVSTGDLKKLERQFKENSQKGAFDRAKPYLVVPEAPYYKLKEIKSLCNSLGWHELDEREETVNVWHNPLGLEMPTKYYMSCGRYFQAQLRNDFFKVMDASYDLSTAFKRHLDKIHRQIESRIKIVVIYNSRHAPIAAGLVATRGQKSFLYSGAVIKRYRGKGLWRLLVAARQAVSSTGAGHVWLTTSRNARIANKGDLSFPLRTFYKT